ncbi:hypothetical protein [Clostridium faecium]|uniref:Uncharacterized protein n=1 Tax=Clostridium faecium TaxID=2762223 RepID=A0ABR8YSH2_9CLOT|nr:hypothetical protein [Clostridium faecium]MBD8047178.1 hypothetical protein [Clostridium faecium]MDU1348442.1 hypothetical protein [Clostridium argentinense]
MKNKKLNFYFFGDIGTYDKFNPAYACNKEYASEILYIIASYKPFSICKFEIMKKLNIEENKFDDVISSLKLINAIDENEKGYKINFPAFLEKDIVNMDKYLNNIGEVIGDKIISLKKIICEKLSSLTNYRIFTNERLLYHIICDKIFDGTAFDFFEAKKVFCTSKLQKGNRDYITVAYEDSSVVDKCSNKLLCSSNNYRAGDFIFNSFGDLNGARKDVYRFFRVVQKGLENSSPFYDLNLSYIKVIDDVNKDIAKRCGELIYDAYNNSINYKQLTNQDKNLIKFLSEINYITINDESKSISVNIPIFKSNDKVIINEISDIILSNIFSIVEDTFENFERNAPDLTGVIHKVDIKEIANELWHQIFGSANEYLVKKSFVYKPEYISGEGRYLRSLYVDQ